MTCRIREKEEEDEEEEEEEGRASDGALPMLPRMPHIASIYRQAMRCKASLPHVYTKDREREREKEKGRGEGHAGMVWLS